ncbi:MAG: glycosyltransferase [bacterium]|nr:glycosyltransferase [bacterium]
MTPIVSKNLQALASVQASLHERIHWPVEGDHLGQSPAGEWTLTHRGTRVPAMLTDQEIQRACEGVGPESRSTIFLFGVGLGELLKALLERAPQATVIAWERDPWLLRQALTLHDWVHPLIENRLRFALNADLGPLVQSGLGKDVVFHPLLSRMYANEFTLVHDGVKSNRVLVCCGSLFVDPLASALRKEGFSVLSLDSERISEEETNQVIQTWNPALLIGINHKNGLAEFCEERGVHSIFWEIDPALNEPDALRLHTPHSHIFTYRKGSMAAFERAGFPNVSYLPLAADEIKCKPQLLTSDQQIRYGAKVSFVGTSLLQNLEEFQQAFSRQHQAWQGTGADQCGGLMQEVVRRQQADLSHYSIPEHLDALCPGFRLHCKQQAQIDPALYLAEISGSEKRLNYMAALAPHEPVAWGDEGWRKVEPHGVRYMGPALHNTELPLIYCGSTINVDIGRLYQNDIVTMRVFDILACGGFVLAEHSEALSDLFEIGVEVESYRTLGELTSKVEYFLEHPEEARTIAQRGRESVLQRHTIRGRVAHMLDAVSAASTMAA